MKAQTSPSKSFFGTWIRSMVLFGCTNFQCMYAYYNQYHVILNLEFLWNSKVILLLLLMPMPWVSQNNWLLEVKCYDKIVQLQSCLQWQHLWVCQIFLNKVTALIIILQCDSPCFSSPTCPYGQIHYLILVSLANLLIKSIAGRSDVFGWGLYGEWCVCHDILFCQSMWTITSTGFATMFLWQDHSKGFCFTVKFRCFPSIGFGSRKLCRKIMMIVSICMINSVCWDQKYSVAVNM